jgi:hypothetical protein
MDLLNRRTERPGKTLMVEKSILWFIAMGKTAEKHTHDIVQDVFVEKADIADALHL